MFIRSAIHYDFDTVAKLHQKSIATGFLSKLGLNFLKELYNAIGKQDSTKIFVAEADGNVCGFIAGTVCTHRLYKRVVFQNGYRFAFLLLKFMFDVKMLGMLCETFYYGFKKKNNISSSISSELLSISVDETFRGKGVGKKLVSELEFFFKNSGVKTYKVVTFSEDRKANDFYHSCNFILNRQFVHHDNLMNEYIKEI
jgi:ribosomal protein S18 acetylase RimI-like enzyme